MKLGTHDRQKKERQICNYIKTRAETYFGSKGGNFESSFPVSTNIINFSVKNLKGEVIEPGWVSVFDPYEKLSFSVKIVPDKSGNMKVWLVVDGKYGPGLFKPHSGDYHEMFPEYKQPLKDYTLRFIQNHIRSWLLEMPNRP